MADRKIVIEVKKGGSGGVGGAAADLASKASNATKGFFSSAAGALKNPLGGLDRLFGPIMGVLSKLLGPVLLIAGAVAVLVQASKFLSRTLDRLFSVFLRILQPIGNIVATLLQPLIILLTPIAKVFNAMFRPFIVQANALMRQGAQLISQGGDFAVEGIGLIGSAVLLLFKPLLNAFLIVFSEGLITVVNVLLLPLALLLQGIDAIAGALGVNTGLYAAFEQLRVGAIEGVRGAIRNWITDSDRAVLAFGAQQIVYGQTLLAAIQLNETLGLQKLSEDALIVAARDASRGIDNLTDSITRMTAAVSSSVMSMEGARNKLLTTGAASISENAGNSSSGNYSNTGAGIGLVGQ